MLRYMSIRTARALLTLWVILTVVFVATRISGDTIDFLLPEGTDPDSRAAMVQYLGLDRSIIEQYAIYVREFLGGHFGLSFYERRPVEVIYLERLGPSLALYASALILAIVLGMPLGIVAALKRNTALARGIMTAAFLGYAIPNFVLAILLLLIFSFHLGWLPSAGAATPAHYVMPTLAVGSVLLAAVVRFTRSSMLDVLSQDYLRTARAKGVSERVLVLRHALRNALIPILTVIGLQVTNVLGAAVIIETVFAWPGLGEQIVLATIRRDYPTLQFGVLGFAAVVVTVNLAVDLLYSVVDPRVRVGG
ncbi:peptide ABC transporter permease [Thalassobaculum fulvum]|uniref:Peptide ABC transporter permease n=1 Tax=Thalassobaculum fulvum TaxID=1633335 RepID=A0A919CQ93_9PROT|nr:ABC transporter permease [Thalassobaculum fulvum]GHD53879.1 peptide ABC transporter permease [Thalassobaculum fulvum]